MPSFDYGLAAETVTLGQALLAGTLMGIYYDLFRILRRVFRFGYATIVGQDIFFWLTSGVGMFFAATWVSGGVVRIYFVAVALLGWGVYAATVGALLMRLVSGVVFVVKGVGGYLAAHFVHPFERKLREGCNNARIKLANRRKKQKNK